MIIWIYFGRINVMQFSSIDKPPIVFCYIRTQPPRKSKREVEVNERAKIQRSQKSFGFCTMFTYIERMLQSQIRRVFFWLEINGFFLSKLISVPSMFFFLALTKHTSRLMPLLLLFHTSMSFSHQFFVTPTDFFHFELLKKKHSKWVVVYVCVVRRRRHNILRWIFHWSSKSAATKMRLLVDLEMQHNTFEWPLFRIKIV